MCLISLSLSRVLSRVPSMAQSWCIPSFAIVVGSYDVSPPLLSCDELSFPFEVILSDWVFYENTRCMYCRAYLWWQWDIMCLLMYVLVTNLRVPPMNLCIGVGTRSWLSGRNFGTLFEVLCVGWMNLRLCDAYRIIMPTDTWGDNGVSRWH